MMNHSAELPGKTRELSQSLRDCTWRFPCSPMLHTQMQAREHQFHVLTKKAFRQRRNLHITNVLFITLQTEQMYFEFAIT